MRDPYVYPHTNILKNLANIQDEEELSCMEAEYTSLRLAELVTKESASHFNFLSLCDMHRYIFQDVYEWAGEIRVINIEKNVTNILDDMNKFLWKALSVAEASRIFSEYLAKLWRVHPYREGNTRTIITFCSQFIESKGFYVDSDLFKDNAQYMRTALVAANAIFSDLGDKRKPEYLNRIVLDALERGQKMKDRVADVIKMAGFDATEKEMSRPRQHRHLKRKNSILFLVFLDFPHFFIHSGWQDTLF